jgi:hypothetical protein
MALGRCSAGGVVSVTVTEKLPVDVLPTLSVAEQVTVVVPRGKIEPDSGEQVTGSVPSTASVAVATKVTVAPAGPVAAAVMEVGKFREGGGVLVCALVTRKR